MQFELEKNIRKNITKNYRIRLRQTNQVDEGGANQSVIDGTTKIRFVNTDNSVDKTTDTIEIDYGTGFTDEGSFNVFASLLNGKSYNYNNTMLIAPINHTEIAEYEVASKIPTIRVETNVNYYDDDINSVFYSREEASIPSIYSTNLNMSKEKTKDSILSGDGNGLFPDTNKVIFSDKIKMSSYKKNKKSYPSLVEIDITKTEQDIFRSVLKDNNMFSAFISNAEENTQQNITLENLRASLSNNYNYSFLNDIVANLTIASSDVGVFGEEATIPNRRINFLDKLKVIGDLQSKSLYHSNFKTIVEKGAVPNETIFYKIKKFMGRQTNTPIKTFFLPSNGNVTTFLDTQVLYNGTYSYEISAFVIVYGVEYQYALQSLDYISGKATYNVTSITSPMMIEVKMFSTDVTVSPNPPMPPSVRFINNSNSENSLRVALQLTEGQMDDHFIGILAKDEDLFMKVDPNTKKTLFKYNKEQIVIQMFKLAKKPKSILDFRNGSVTTYGEGEYSDAANINNLNSTNLILKDIIFPNTKYYYIFRTKSGSGMLSNPSPVFEVEMVKDSDDTKIIVSSIQLDKPAETETDRKFRSLFQVRPSMNQSVLQQTSISREIGEDSPSRGVLRSLLDEYVLGDSEESIWGRKFKLRVKSNDSGKIVDINIKFDLIKDKKIEDL